MVRRLHPQAGRRLDDRRRQRRGRADHPAVPDGRRQLHRHRVRLQVAGPMWGGAMDAIQRWIGGEDFRTPDLSGVKPRPYTTVPSVTGMSVASAMAVLHSAGLKAVDRRQRHRRLLHERVGGQQLPVGRVLGPVRRRGPARARVPGAAQAAAARRPAAATAAAVADGGGRRRQRRRPRRRPAPTPSLRGDGSAQLAAYLRGDDGAVGAALDLRRERRPSPCPWPACPRRRRRSARRRRSPGRRSRPRRAGRAGSRRSPRPRPAPCSAISARPPSAKAVAASRRFLASVESTPMTSSSVSSRASLPATSALVIAVSTIRSVDERSSSRALHRGGQVGAEAVLEGAHEGHCGRLDRGGTHADCRRPGRRGRRRRRRADGVRRRGRRGSTRCARSPCRCCPRATRPLRVLHLSDIHMTPGQTRKQEWLRGLASLRPDLVVTTGDNLAHRDVGAGRARRVRRPARRAGGVRLRLQRLLRADPQEPAALPAARRRPAQHPLPHAALARPARRAGRARLARPDQRPASSTVGRPADRLRRGRRPAPGLRPARRGRRPGRPHGRPAAGGHARAVPAGARPVRRRRLRRDPRRAHPRRPGLPARGRRADHQLRPRARPRQGPAPAPGRLRAPATRAPPGCTSRPASAPRRTPGSGSPAAPRPRC